jgi:hypothetical protein
MLDFRLLLAAAFTGAALCLPVPAHAVPIPGIVSTGVDAAGAPLGNGAPEQHYGFASTDSVPTTSDGHGGLTPASSEHIVVFTQPNLETETSWSGNSNTSAWIGPNNPNRLVNAIGRYYYSLSFDIPSDLDPSTAKLEGWLFGDNGVADIRLNTNDTGLQNFVPGTYPSPFQVPFHFTIDQGFLPGDNFLEFRVDNDGGPTGLRVQLVSSIDPAPIPEPGTIMLVLVGMAALSFQERRRMQHPR